MKVHLSMNEKLKDLRTSRHLTLEDAAKDTNLSKSALGNYEKDNYQDINPFALRTLAEYYDVSTDYLLGLTDNKVNSGLEIDALHLTDDAVDVLKSDSINSLLISQLLSHPAFRHFLIDLEIYVDGYATNRIQDVNAILEITRRTILQKHPDANGDVNTTTLQHAQVDEDRYFLQVLLDDLSTIMKDIKESHAKDVMTADDNSLSVIDDFEKSLADMQSGKGSPQEAQVIMFCKKLGINYNKLTDVERVTLINILSKSKLLKTPSNRKSHSKR